METKVQDRTNAVSSAGDLAAADMKKAVEEAEMKSRLEASAVFMEEMDRSEAEMREKKARSRAEAGRDDDKGTEREAGERLVNGRDKAALSEESAYYKLSPEELLDLDRMWGKEAADQAWANILKWNLSLAKSVADELSSLAEIYKELLSAILANTTAGVQGQQLALLDKTLSDILVEVLNTRMGELDALFERFGTGTSMAAVKAALYRAVTGNAISDRELDQVFKESVSQKDASPDGRSGGIRVPVNEEADESAQGIIYQKAGEGRIKSDSQYAQRMRKETAAAVWTMAEGQGKPEGAQASISSSIGKNTVYSSGDLEIAERFAGYMNRGGNLLKSPVLSGGSEELYGFLAAVVSIKSQIYMTATGIHKGLASDLREAVDRMIDFQLQEALRQSEAEAGSGPYGKKPSFQPRSAYRIYYYIMNLYQTTKDPVEAVNKGLRHACQQYFKRKEYEKKDFEPGSFFTKEKREPVSDWKEGKRFLERDWNDFLGLLGRGDQGGVLYGVLVLSPWGIFAEPEASPSKGGGGSPVFLIGVGAAVLLLIAIFIFLRI